MQEQYSIPRTELLPQSSIEAADAKADLGYSMEYEAISRLVEEVNETYESLLAEDADLATQVTAVHEAAEVPVLPEVLTHKDRAERIGNNLALIRKDR